MNEPTLGSSLKTARELKRLSLREVESATGISNAYLSQLENNKVKHPSPAFLHKLSKVYDLDYTGLMDRAGHIPDGLALRKHLHAWSPRFKAQAITEEEECDLLEYLLFLRAKNRRVLSRDNNRAGGKPSFVGPRAML